MSLNALRDEVHQMACDKGWWTEDRTFGELIALVHSELSEALEEYRNGNPVNETYYPNGPKPEGVPSELADVIIRVLDLAGRYGIDIEAAIAEKVAFNATRPHRHGGKTL